MTSSPDHFTAMRAVLSCFLRLKALIYPHCLLLVQISLSKLSTKRLRGASLKELDHQLNMRSKHG